MDSTYKVLSHGRAMCYRSAKEFRVWNEKVNYLIGNGCTYVIISVDGRTGIGMPFRIRTDSVKVPDDTVLYYGPETYLKAR